MSNISADPEVFAAIDAELVRQNEHIELIASENYTSKYVRLAQGSILTNKYAEGYPGKRFYGGCEHVDVIEQLAINRAKELFGAEYVNVQPHSGSQANQAIFFAFLKPGDTVMGMNLGHGGHLTHGSPANISGKMFNIIPYGIDEVTGEINYDEMERLAAQHKPKLIIGGASAYSLKFDWERMSKIATANNAYFMVDMAHYAGLIAAGVYPNPVPYADFCTSTTHKTLRGPRGGIILAKAKYEKQINSAVFPMLQGGPLMHIIAGKAIAFGEALKPEFREYAARVIENARVMANTLTKRGFKIVSNRTDSHMFLVDLRGKVGLTGKKADKLLGAANITVNKNSVPNDPENPFITSGIRIGTPAITTRGFTDKDCEDVANIIADLLDNHSSIDMDAADLSEPINSAKSKLKVITDKYPI
jgi:glycine hydroxymethyltransferase